MSAFGVRVDIVGRAGNRLVDHPAGRDCFGDCLAQPSLARALRNAGPFFVAYTRHRWAAKRRGLDFRGVSRGPVRGARTMVDGYFLTVPPPAWHSCGKYSSPSVGCKFGEVFLDNLQMTSDDEYVAIQRLQHPITGVTVYLPMGQELPDTKTTLERDGLITCQYDEDGKYVGTLLHDPHNLRVLCWQLTVNADARRLGR